MTDSYFTLDWHSSHSSTSNCRGAVQGQVLLVQVILTRITCFAYCHKHMEHADRCLRILAHPKSLHGLFSSENPKLMAESLKDRELRVDKQRHRIFSSRTAGNTDI